MHGIGYVLYGRWAIFFMSFISLALASGVTMCYLIILGESTSSLVKDVFGVGKNDFFAQKNLYIILVTLI